MFKKILIANRGEIALRIIRTCKLLGIKTVAIYSDADAEALHTKYADEAYHIGPSKVQDSYLQGEKIIQLAKDVRCEAIHPGYGFLSENSRFAELCEKNQIQFIGPSSSVIKAMGNKIDARKTMEKIGVPIIPGKNIAIDNEEVAKQNAAEIGYPIMLKAAAGGGGIGMQVVATELDLVKAFSGNKKRAEMFFQNGEMYLEKFIENPRHIEVQLIADSYGNAIHLWERECSIQRRHQKVIEEAPSQFLDEQTRLKMTDVAVQAAIALGYVNAGTMEFLVDEQKNFYFLEMNTRLQVEHPVTEEITGLDIVEQQLKIAAGHSLAFKQSDIKRSGHAIEARIYAEDPQTFFPSPGKMTKLNLPSEDVRLEFGFKEETTITPFYDPMIGKVIVKGRDRKEAISKLAAALDKLHVEGIKTNTLFLRKIINNQKYQDGKITTDFIEQLQKEEGGNK